ncbi:MAG: acylneuraminate cytidylyltransferase family protein [Bacteroidota bacterium]
MKNNQINILGIIPARGGSKRIPNKNKKKLAGKELVRYAIEASTRATEITDLVLSSDDQEILNIGKDYKNLICLDRPDEISGDDAPAITYVLHALAELPKDYDYVVIIQPTSPFTTGLDIDKTIQLLRNSEADSSVSVMKLDHAIHPAKLKTMDELVLNPYLEKENGRMAAHELPEVYVRNCSVYVSSIKTIESGKIIGNKCLGYEMPRERSLDINDPIDFEFAEFIIQKRK